MPGLNKRRNVRAPQHQTDDTEHRLHEHGKRPYPATKTLRSGDTSPSAVKKEPSECIPDIFKGANAAFAKLPKVKKELADVMLPLGWGTTFSQASGSNSSPSPPNGPHRKGKHPRRPPEAQMHHFPRQSCDECHNHKVKCVKVPGGSCERCVGLGTDCKFSLPKKYGRPSKSAASAQQSSSSRTLPPRRQVKQDTDSGEEHSTTNNSFSYLTSGGHPSWLESSLAAQDSEGRSGTHSPQQGSTLAPPPGPISHFQGLDSSRSSAPASTTDLEALSAVLPPRANSASVLPDATSATSGTDQPQEMSTPASSHFTTSSSTFGEDLFRPPSPPTIGQQSFRNLRERSESIDSEGHGASEGSSSVLSLASSRAGSLDHQHANQHSSDPTLGRVVASSSPFKNHASLAECGPQASSSTSPAMGSFLFTTSPWQQSALPANAWDNGGNKSSMPIGPLSSTFDSLAGANDGSSELPGGVDFESLMNTFDANLFTTMNRQSTGGDVEGVSDYGLGLLPDLTSQDGIPSFPDALLQPDLATVIGDETIQSQGPRQQRSVNDRDAQGYSPKTPAASGSHLSAAIVAPQVSTAPWNWNYNDPSQLVSSPFSLSDASSSPQIPQNALSSDGGRPSEISSREALRSYSSAVQQSSLNALLAPFGQNSSVDQGFGSMNGLGLMQGDSSRHLQLGSSQAQDGRLPQPQNYPMGPSYSSIQRAHTVSAGMWPQADGMRQAVQGWPLQQQQVQQQQQQQQQQPLNVPMQAPVSRSFSVPSIAGSSASTLPNQHHQSQGSMANMAMQAQRELDLRQGWSHLLTTFYADPSNVPRAMQQQQQQQQQQGQGQHQGPQATGRRE
ncbi:hypothetical protein CF319_g6818 [Tilletia indica]|nr:hypothetical protein CF319_g6818 [Tilletia indica]